MADNAPADGMHRQIGGQPIRFQLRHLLYITLAVSAVLGIPGLAYIAGWLAFPWLMFALIMGPILIAQFLFVVSIPPLRRSFFGTPRPHSRRPEH